MSAISQLAQNPVKYKTGIHKGDQLVDKPKVDSQTISHVISDPKKPLRNPRPENKVVSRKELDAIQLYLKEIEFSPLLTPEEEIK